MDPHMFDGLIVGLLVIGVVIGLALAGGIWAVDHWIIPHIYFGWR